MASWHPNSGNGNSASSGNSNSNSSSIDPDQEARLEEFRYYWSDFLEEPDTSELLLAELELNKLCVKYLIKQTRKLPSHKKPRSLILNSCKFHPTDGTAALLVQFFQDNQKWLQRIRLESAYVGHLPTPTATVLLQGMAQYAVHLESIQLVDIDPRPTAVAHAVARLASRLRQLRNLEFRHCRVDAPFLQTLGQALVLHRQNNAHYHHHHHYHHGQRILNRLTFHACVLDDELLRALTRQLTKDSTTTSSGGAVQALRQLSLPSNRLTQGSVPMLTQLLTKQSQLRHLDLQRNARLFWGFAEIAEGDNSSNNIYNNNSNNNNRSLSGMDHLSASQQQDVLSWLGDPRQQSMVLSDFKKALSCHSHLIKLDLHRCGVTDVVARHIFQALEENSGNGTNDGSGSVLQELNLSGNELTCTWEEEEDWGYLELDEEEYATAQPPKPQPTHWIQSLPKLQSLRVLDLPRHVSGTQSGWYDAPTTLASRLDRHRPDQSSSSSSSSSPRHSHSTTAAAAIPRSLFVQHLARNTSLHSLLHDGTPSIKAEYIVQRNVFLHRAQQHLIMLRRAVRDNQARIEANQNHQFSGVLLNNHGTMMTNWDALWPSILQHYTLQLEASSGLYLLLQDELSSSA
mmetsp:Transcript_15853/g.34750  ORF Transcript_15853/g.34750 Transcript_15853/m.34750 type:complete len:628 (-) Transcript_15853:68-1951(-)|eukprot:CAMPEP_0168783116 /NCGR_PEP_ID=MMETSP0725-20121227/9515_1 /TAXON_ID=265536 /ORGANISM="Amphiprora sp., Strain CCMP467" /LENGTH=627 /DNA_ID=CAMNT_0008833073 /DNA_START=30 /DNA_END=1913 /DNA_ORIENTATION=+